MRAYVVVDLGFGDAGKGLLTDFLARHLSAGLVVRYNGGAQAGHNVVTSDGRQHTFSQFGSGSFIPGLRTFLSRHMVIHPAALLLEGAALQDKGLPDVFSRLRVSELALVITPWHQAANRIRELARGGARHGSCGVGVGEAVEDSLSNPAESVLAGDLARTAALYHKLKSIRERKRAELLDLCRDLPHTPALAREWSVFESPDLAERWLDSISPINTLGLVAPETLLKDWLAEAGSAVFEGAQGLLLDAEVGFHPYTTWSRCTAANALNLLGELAPGAEVFTLGVLRSHAVRHGPGPLPTETDALSALISDHNQPNEWQGRVRYGWFDTVLARYALRAAGRLDALALTHMDLPPRLGRFTYSPAYNSTDSFDTLPVEREMRAGQLLNFSLPPALGLEQREKITRALGTVSPLLESCSSNESEVLGRLGEQLNQPVGLLSRGPRAADVEILKPLPG